MKEIYFVFPNEGEFNEQSRTSTELYTERIKCSQHSNEISFGFCVSLLYT